MLLQGRPPLPPMPPTFCERFPDDPSCATNIPIDGGVLAVVILGVVFGLVLMYMEKRKNERV